MFIRQVSMENLLSFGPERTTVDLKDLNILIGPNGSGKSNFLEIFDLLRHTPNEITRPIRQGGGIGDWLWKNGGGPAPVALLEAVVEYPAGPESLRYGITFTEAGHRFELVDEWIENKNPYYGHEQPYLYYRYNVNGLPIINVKDGKPARRSLQRDDVAQDKSILAQRRHLPEMYPELAYLGRTLEEIFLFREWTFGPNSPARMFQKIDMPSDVLYTESYNFNLAMVISRLRQEPTIKARLLEALRQFSDCIDDYDIRLDSNNGQIYMQEGPRIIPATRLSDGTLHYLTLLAILLNPTPPPLICLDEPELGLHPDIIPTLAELLKDAATRTQIIVTTHSASLVDAFTSDPEAILVCEKHEGRTEIKRLSAEELAPWLEEYRLGPLWTSGEIGGNRW